MDQSTTDNHDAVVAEIQLESARNRDVNAGHYGLSALKGPFLANGGAVLALLTFIGNSNAEVEEVAIRWSFAWYGLGLISSLLSQIAMYYAQGCSAIYERNIATTLRLSDTARKQGYAVNAEQFGALSKRLSRATLLLTLLSAFLFVAGSFVALDAIT